MSDPDHTYELSAPMQKLKSAEAPSSNVDHIPGSLGEMQEMIQFLVFESADIHYGISILDTHEVLLPMEATRIPNIEAETLGVINLRGNILPVIDIRRRFNKGYCNLDEDSRIIVCTYGGKMRGILVERIVEVAKLPVDSIEVAEAEELSNHYIKGAGRGREKIFLILNPAAIFSPAVD